MIKLLLKDFNRQCLLMDNGNNIQLIFMVQMMEYFSLSSSKIKLVKLSMKGLIISIFTCGSTVFFLHFIF